MKSRAILIQVSATIGKVSAELIEPPEPVAVLVLAHGAGASMHHPFMKGLALALGALGIGTVRYNFPFTESGKGRPDPPAVAEKTVNSVIEKAHDLYPTFPLVAGGKSFGGRMTSQLVAKDPPPFLRALVFYGFPLHAPGKPSTDRAAHLVNITKPMLFLQGTRDALADLTLIKEVTSQLKTAKLSTFDGADHSFKAGKKEMIPALADATASWLETVL